MFSIKVYLYRILQYSLILADKIEKFLDYNIKNMKFGILALFLAFAIMLASVSAQQTIINTIGGMIASQDPSTLIRPVNIDS